jgi:hypothetical protein
LRSEFVLLLLVSLRLTLPAQEPPVRSGAAGQIVSEVSADSLRVTVEKLAGFGTRHTLSDTLSGTRGIGAARRWIKAQLDRYARSAPNMSVQYFPFTAPPSARLPHPVTVVNVLALLQPGPGDGGLSGAGKPGCYLVSGHYDSRAGNALDSVGEAPGADDDASGTAIVLELARVFSKHRFRTKILFAAFAGEEQGLFGSTALAEFARENGWQIEGVLNNDIAGGIRGGGGEIESTYVRLFSEAYSPSDTGSVFRQRNLLGLENDGGSRTLARYIQEIGPRYVPNFNVRMVYRRDRFLRGGDHLPFHERGFPAVRFTEARENFDHQHQDVRIDSGKQYGDLPGFVNFAYCANIARINAAALATLALAPSTPAAPVIVTTNLEYGTRLRWRRNAEQDLAGYSVRWRETASAAWQYARFTADTSISLGVSKDDFLFGVQAVDRDGNASLVAIPRPGGR